MTTQSIKDLKPWHDYVRILTHEEHCCRPVGTFVGMSPDDPETALVKIAYDHNIRTDIVPIHIDWLTPIRHMPSPNFSKIRDHWTFLPTHMRYKACHGDPLQLRALTLSIHGYETLCNVIRGSHGRPNFY